MTSWMLLSSCATFYVPRASLSMPSPTRPSSSVTSIVLQKQGSRVVLLLRIVGIPSVYVRPFISHHSTLARRNDPFRSVRDDVASFWFVSSMTSSHETWCSIFTCSSHHPGWICSGCMYPCVLKTRRFRFLPRASRRVPFFTCGRHWIFLERPWTHQGETHHRRGGSAIGGTTSH